NSAQPQRLSPRTHTSPTTSRRRSCLIHFPSSARNADASAPAIPRVQLQCASEFSLQIPTSSSPVQSRVQIKQNAVHSRHCLKISATFLRTRRPLTHRHIRKMRPTLPIPRPLHQPAQRSQLSLIQLPRQNQPRTIPQLLI